MSPEKLAVQIYVDPSTFWVLYQTKNEITWDFYDTAKNFYVNRIISILKANYLDFCDTALNL